MLMVALLASATTTPSVVGEWEDDSWLSNIIGPERLANGDEFGCHGYEGVITTEEHWVIGWMLDSRLSGTSSPKPQRD